MLPRTAFVQFLPPRLGKARERLAAMMWSEEPAGLAVTATKPSADETGLSEADSLSYAAVKRTPHHWGSIFDQRWWTVEVPAAAKADRGRVVYLRWKDQAEATVYVEGQAWAGVDPGHVYVALPTGLTDRGGVLRVESTCCRTGVWVPGAENGLDPEGSRFEGAFLARRDDAAWSAYHDVEVLLEVAMLMHRKAYPGSSDWPRGGGYRRPVEGLPPVCRKIVDGLDRGVDALDREGPAAMAKVTSALLKSLPADATAITATLTGHAHIDLVWLWPERTGEFKAVHSFANVLDVQRRYPELTFGYSQPASYEAVGKRQPELLKRVRKSISKGSWEPTGALYVESDTQLACGEALVRAFALGQEGFEDLRADGSPSRVVWIPDVFGYSGVLPTLMKGFGVPYFFTTKMHWSSANHFPFSSYKWVGNDGSEVLAHLAWEHYNLGAMPAELDRAQLNHRQSAVHPEALVPTGYGDGGGGPNDAMCERARRMSDLATMPKCEWGTIEGFFDRMAEPAVADALPTWQGEMYLEYHRGVQTTQGALKHVFRLAERGLQVWEAARCVRGLDGGDAGLRQAWKRVVFAQFHDYIPGSSIPRVYDEAVPELRAIAEETAAAAGRELSGLAEKSSKRKGKGKGKNKNKSDDNATACVFNPLPVERKAWVDGRRVTLGPLAGVAKAALVADDVPAVKVGKHTLDNGRVRVRFNGKGEVSSMSVDGEALAWSGSAGRLFTFPDHPTDYDAWDIDRFTLSNGSLVKTSATCEVEDSDPSTAAMAFTRRVGEASEATVRYELRGGESVLRVTVDLDWQERQTLLKFVVPTAYVGKEARYGAPYGSALRPQWAGPLANDAMFEVPGSRWACVSDDTQQAGAMVVTESKYGFGAYRGMLHVSLVRSAMHTGVGGGNHESASGDTVSDLGRHTIRLALGGFSADAARADQPAALADALFTEAVAYDGLPMDAGLLGLEGGETVVPAWAKPEGKGAWTLRLHETLGRRGALEVRLASGWRATPTDLRGEATGEALKPSGSMAFGPYGVYSLRIERG